jgi:ABC-type bacteriocin/lantibiotic exporter with double-glycine peptidase domain
LTGLLTPEAGLIESDNINLDSYQRLSIASYVSQNFIIPSEYLQTCFRLYNPKITDMEIKLLLNLVELSDILKYNSKIGVNGTLLSGGQRQRIGIALSLASERDVFILDEATTGLEPALEINILLKIKERLKDKILIIISHSELLTILVDYEVDISKN